MEKRARASGGTGGSPVASGGSPEAFRAANPHGETQAEAAAPRQMPDAGRVGRRAGRPFHPARAVSATALACLWITVPDSNVHDRF